MPTTKTRIQISVPKRTRDALKMLAKQDEVPVATKAAELIEDALELEEDVRLGAIIADRLKKKARYIKDSDAIWM
jgi:predicted DNA-binding protein